MLCSVYDNLNVNFGDAIARLRKILVLNVKFIKIFIRIMKLNVHIEKFSRLFLFPYLVWEGKLISST